MKNKFKYILSGILLSVTMISCEDWLSTKPLNDMVADDFWKDGSDVKSVVMTCYRSLLEDDFMERVILGGELRSDNVMEYKSTPEEMQFILNCNILPSNGLSKWTSFYRVINYCNTVLHYAPEVVDLDPDYTEGMLRANEAEVLTLRALAYFYLVRIYNEVPYITTPTIDDTKSFKIPKSSESYILEQLISDLKTAEIHAVDEWPTLPETKGRVTKNAVRALLADIYLWQMKYSECIEQCNKILKEVYDPKNPNALRFMTNPLQLVEASVRGGGIFEQVFAQGNSTESIFEIQFDDTEKVNTKLFDFYGRQNNNDGEGQLSATSLTKWNLFTEKDIRGKESFRPDFNGYYRIFKYVGLTYVETTSGTGYIYRNASSTSNWIVYRLPDVMLMKAEALVELNRSNEDLTNALSLVNKTYMRSNPNQSDSLKIENYDSKEKMEELVMDERQREFLFEGKRWFDLLRMVRRDNSSQRMLSKYLLRKYSTNAGIVQSKLSIIDALYMPINADELRLNTELEQNPFYNTTAK